MVAFGWSVPRGLVPRYYLFRVTNTSGFFLPVAIIVLQHKGFGLDFVGLAYAVYAFAKLVVEVPTGYVGDVLGRRASLAVGSGVRAVVLGVYPFLGSEAAYLGVHVLWAVGRAFRSGTQDAWLYEILQARYDESDFARIEGRGNTAKLAVDALTAVTGGVLYEVDPAYPFLGTAAIALAGIPLLWSFPRVDQLGSDGDDCVDDDDREDRTDREDRDDPCDPAGARLGVREAVDLLRLQTGRPAVRWFVLYAAVFYSLFVVTRIYEQPALAAVDVPVAGFGVLYAGFKLVSAGVASSVGRVHDALGTRGVMASLIPLYAVVYASIALVPVLVVPVLFCNRGIRTLTRPVTSQYLNEQLDDVGRATVLSGASMALAVVGGVARIVAGAGTAALGVLGFLPLAGVVLALAGGVCWVAFEPVRSPGGVDVGSSGQAAASD